MIPISEARERLTEKASTDNEFRSRLLNDPQKTVEEEFGVTVPEGFAIKVHEQSTTEAHLVLPPDPKLGESDLHLVAGSGHEGGLNWGG